MQAMGVVKVESFAAWEEVRLQLFKGIQFAFKGGTVVEIELN